MTAAILVHIALAAYLGAAVAYGVWLFRSGARASSLGWWLLAAGFLLHGASLAAELTSGEGELFRFGEGLSILTWFTVGGALYVDRRHKMAIVSAFVAPLALALTAPTHLFARAYALPKGGAMLFLHAGAALAGIAVFAIASVLALFYVLLERQLKERKPGWLFLRLPPLETLDVLSYRLTLVGFVLVSLAIASGAIFTSGWKWDSKELFALATWVVTAVVVNARITVGWRGRRAALLVMAGFVLLLGTYGGLFLRGGGAG
jgi:ABC-type uncharacterized transport system permease subunit